MIYLGKHNLLGVLIDAIDYQAATTRIIEAAVNRQNLCISALAVHGLMTGVLDPQQRCRLNSFDLLVPDGQPVRWSLNWLYKLGLTDRVYGPTLMIKICKLASQEKLPIFLYGSRPEVLNLLTANLTSIFPELKIAGVLPSLFRRTTHQEKLDIISTIQKSGAALTFVGLGCPRQEVWVYEHRSYLNMPLIAVGAAFDFHAGTLPQAPVSLQQMGLEWFYRLLKEPKRLWKRYLLLNPYYSFLIILQKIGILHFDLNQCELPKTDLNYG